MYFAMTILLQNENVFLRFWIVSSNELVVLDSLENSKQYKNAGKRFRVYGALLTSVGSITYTYTVFVYIINSYSHRHAQDAQLRTSPT